MATLDRPKKVRIVAERGLLELRDETGKTLRSLIYTSASPESEGQARVLLTREAIALGYRVSDEPWPSALAAPQRGPASSSHPFPLRR